MNVYVEIEKLMEYSIKNGLVLPEDRILVTNLILDSIGIVDYVEFSSEERKEIEKYVENVKYPTEILDNITEWAARNGKLIANTTTFKDLLNAKIMGQILPRTSEISKVFWGKYGNENRESATDYFYEISKQSNYIRTDRISKNMYWNYKNKYGELEITVNLSKPEKDPKEIAMAKNKVTTNYPKCLLCKENEGYSGHLNHPARQNHRIIKLDLNNEDWYLQYSPYTYYNEHSIVFSGTHRPMKIDKASFERLLKFVELFPHYMIGSNADLPIVGGSILTHDHFQAGRHEFPMEKANISEKIKFSGYEDIEAGIVNWPLSVIRLRGEKDRLVELADKILQNWIDFSCEKLNIFSHTDGERHNTITPIARYKNGKYELDLTLRNNLTTPEHPLGIFHPHSEHHNIKKENIGLIEVMGLAVLPGRLKYEMREIEELLNNCKNYDDAFGKMEKNENLKKHVEWLKIYMNDKNLSELLNRDVNLFLNSAVGETFSRVLEDCGVFKNDKNGKAGFLKFIEKVNEEI